MNALARTDDGTCRVTRAAIARVRSNRPPREPSSNALWRKCNGVAKQSSGA
ncbi:hypothetical protein SS05631_c12420 [Sinorhizobium sp. CCBAU 05631]|nr:hypothetical protein SS05631_c12420 [Sinorhizobium sp. CCBAU 05631]